MQKIGLPYEAQMYDEVFALETVPERAGVRVVVGGEQVVVPELAPAVLTIMGQVALGVTHSYIDHYHGKPEHSHGPLSARITRYAHSMGLSDIDAPINSTGIVNQAFKLGLLRTASYDPERWPIDSFTPDEDLYFRLAVQGYGLRQAALQTGHSRATVERHWKHMRDKLRAPTATLVVTIGYYAGLLVSAPEEDHAMHRLQTGE